MNHPSIPRNNVLILLAINAVVVAVLPSFWLGVPIINVILFTLCFIPFSVLQFPVTLFLLFVEPWKAIIWLLYYACLVYAGFSISNLTKNEPVPFFRFIVIQFVLNTFIFLCWFISQQSDFSFG